MRLRRNEYCPIHRSLFCCGREQARKERRVRLGVQRIEDPHHPRGYRELRSPAEMRKLLNRKIVEQNRKCAICHEEFTDYNDIVPDHKEPKGMGGRGETTIQTISKQRVGGAMETKGQPEWVTDDRLTGQCALILRLGDRVRSVGRVLKPSRHLLVSDWLRDIGLAEFAARDSELAMIVRASTCPGLTALASRRGMGL